MSANPATVDVDWRAHARCAEPDVDPEWFFPPTPSPGAAIKAIRICRPCPVKNACLEDALTTGDLWGVRGGIREQDRRRMLGIEPRPWIPSTPDARQRGLALERARARERTNNPAMCGDCGATLPGRNAYRQHRRIEHGKRRS